MSLKRLTPILLAAAVAALTAALLPGVAAGKSKPGLHSFHGTVSAVAKDRSAVRIKRSGRSSVRFVLTRSTSYERVSGASALKRGLRVEIKARKSDGRWIAREIEREDGDDDAGDDNGGDRPKGVSDDPPGDDKGGDRP